MASRAIVPTQQQHQRDGVVAGEGKQKKVGSKVEGNRRALGDIGNLVTIRGLEGKALQQINRPVTRSFCAQLLANAQAAAATAAENNKKVAGVVDGGVGPKKGLAAAGAAKAPVQKKPVAAKPKPEKKVIEISPDTVEVEITKKDQKPEVPKQRTSKKKVQTLTSVLSARSKVACGLTEKPKELVIDIDAADADNQLAAVEYVEDLYKYYKLSEMSSRVHDYMETQPEINIKMRAILVDWLIEVHNKFELTPETLYLTIYIIDRFLSIKIVTRRELQLLGVGAMLIASKYEEIWAPEVNDFVSISDCAYTRLQILAMEKRILGNLEWTLTVPTPYVFLIRFIKASASASDQTEMENMVFFLAELGLMNYQTTIMYCPSMLAASAVYAARSTLDKTPLWTETLKLHTGYSESQLKDCAKQLVGYHSEAGTEENRLKGVYRKYSKSERGTVAQLTPAKNLLA